MKKTLTLLTLAFSLLLFRSDSQAGLMGSSGSWVGAAAGGGGVDTMGAFGSTPNANGGTITGTTLTLQPANASFPGGILSGLQTIGGNKTIQASGTTPALVLRSGTSSNIFEIRRSSDNLLLAALDDSGIGRYWSVQTTGISNIAAEGQSFVDVSNARFITKADWINIGAGGNPVANGIVLTAAGSAIGDTKMIRVEPSGGGVISYLSADGRFATLTGVIADGIQHFQMRSPTNPGAEFAGMKFKLSGIAFEDGSVTVASFKASQFDFFKPLVLDGKLLISTTAPSSPSFCTSASVTASNGTAAFRINVGTSCAVSTGTVTLPAATTGWSCFANNVSTETAVSMTATSTTSITLTNYNRGNGMPANWTDNDILVISCTAF